MWNTGTVDFTKHGMDTRLVGAVQAAAGARRHESGNLLQRYYFAACRRAGALGPETATGGEADSELHDAETALRRFLFECRRPAFARFHASGALERLRPRTP
jgi:hypothetical protein